jgi:hypothetical protein
MDAQQAAEALKQVAAAEKRSAAAYSYNQSAPYCFIWGAVWLLGYGAQAVAPRNLQWQNWWWLALTIAGAVISMAIGRTQGRRNGMSGTRFGLLLVIIWLFAAATFAVLAPRNGLQVGAFFPLLFAAIYAAIGLWLGLRYILVGAFMAAATLIAFFFLRDVFFFWMAVMGGGSLLLTGLWLKQA